MRGETKKDMIEELEIMRAFLLAAKRQIRTEAGAAAIVGTMDMIRAKAEAVAEMAKAEAGTCECGDPGCPAHKGLGEHKAALAATTVYRIDMEDETGTAMCEECAADALDSGVFTTRD